MNHINYFSHNWAIKQALNKHILARLPMVTGRVLDLGCGERPFEKDILKFAHTYTGLDWAKSIHDTKADIIADLNEPIDIESNSFDSVVSFEVLEHLCEPQTMLSESYRILKNNGVLLLSMPFQWWVHEAPWDYQRYTKYGLEYQLKKAGFVEIEIQETTGFWLLWVLKLNYQLARLTKRSFVGIFFKIVLIPFWFCVQHIAILFDKVWKETNETAGYVVVARKSI